MRVRVRRLVGGVVVALAVVVGFGAADVAAAPAPHLHWRTIRTPCCDVHFPADLESAGQAAAAVVDDCVDNAVSVIQVRPSERIQLTLHDVTDSPNGFANVVPRDNVELRAITPEDDSELAKTAGWMRMLIQHEIFHVVHLDVVRGVPAVVNVVLGKTWPPNLIQPRLFVEGMATWAETRFTDGGRLRSSLFRAPLRIAALAGDRWSLDDAANASRRPPGGAAAYVYGAFFVEFLTQKYGEQLWAAYADDYGGQLIPYSAQRSLERFTHRDLKADWDEFLDVVAADAAVAKARVVARGGETPKRRLTRIGGQIRSPTFLADGTLVFGADPPDGPPGIYALRGLPDAVPLPVPLVRTNDVADLTAVDDVIVFAQTDIQNAWFSTRDLFRLETDGRVRQLTFNQRLKNPSAIPGTRTVVAEERTGSRSALVVVDVDSGAVRRFYDAPAGEIVYTPQPTPDGRAVVVARSDASGFRSAVRIDIDSGRATVVVAGRADVADPVYVDDHTVVAVDDRDGIFNVYATDVDSGAVVRVVDTLGGASQPVLTPDGRGVVFVDSHLDGGDLYVAGFDLAQSPRVAPLPPKSTSTSTSTSTPATSTMTSEPYNAVPYLLPLAWVPLVDVDPILGVSVGFATDGADPAGLVSYSLRLAVDSQLWRPAGSLQVRLTDLTLPLSLGVEVRPIVSDRVRENDGVPELQRETFVRANASVTLPLRHRRFAHSLTFGTQHSIAFDETGLTSRPDSLVPVYPSDVSAPQTQTFNLDWSYSSTESYRDSVSNERGVSVFSRLRLGDRLLASDVNIREVIVDVRAFEPVPGLANHVVAAYLSGGASFDDRPGSLFVAGGFAGRDLLQDVFTGQRSGPGILRGFAGAHLVGDVLAAATLEYRFPLLEIEQGIETLPAFVDRVTGVVFVDSAVANDPDRVNAAAVVPFAAGLGAELRLQLVLGYYGQYLARVGYARGVTVGGVDQAYAVLGFPY